MGWWDTDRAGVSFAREPGRDMVWGDGPADTMDNALEAIVDEYVRVWGRKPTQAELLAGLRFSMNHHDLEEG